MKKIINIWLIFFIIGLLLIGTGVLVVFLQNKNKNDRFYTTATITRIENPEKDGRKVFVKYLALGEEYEEELKYYTSGMVEGNNIEIYYLKSKPEVISCDAQDSLLWILPGIGGFFFILGGIGVLVNVIKINKAGKIKKIGNVIFAPIKEVKEIKTINFRGKHPYKIICSYKDPETKKLYTYDSDLLWFDPNYMIANNKITNLKVYVDPNNKNHYAVETDFFERS